MLEKYDELEKEISKAVGEDMERAKKLSEEKKALLKKMSKQELESLMNRPYPPQYKSLIKKYI